MKNNKTENIIFYAPTGKYTTDHKIGGAEAGCRKSIEILKKAGFNLILLEKPIKRSSSKLSAVLLMLNLLITWIKLIFLVAKTSNSAVHVAGFYLKQVYFEWLIIKTAKFLGSKTTYEIRNGGMIEAFQSRGRLYRYFMTSILSSSTDILCQGYDYVRFIEEKLHRESIYYPNYLMDSFVTANNIDRSQESIIKLIFVGRVVKDKNIEFILEVCAELKKRYPNFALDIVGAYEDAYHNLLVQTIHKHQLNDNVVFHGRKEFDDIYHSLQRAHFFVFPSKEKREGHSNALTEAMGCGVVPIVSTAGFNESIVGNSGLVIKEFDPRKYSEKIYEIWSSGQWLNLSESVHQRVANNYTESIVKASLLKAYD